MVYKELAAIGTSPSVDLEHPAADAVQDSAIALATLAAAIRERVSRDIDTLSPEDRRQHFRELRDEIGAYDVMWRHVMPTIEAYWARTVVKVPKDLPNPQELKALDRGETIKN